MFSFSNSRRPLVTELAQNLFTDEESARITSLRRQFLLYPDGFALDVSYRRLEFARWLIARGYLSEWNASQPRMRLQELREWHPRI